MRQLVSSALLQALLIVLVVAGWWWPNRLQDPDPVSVPQGVHARKFDSLSYPAYRPGESPLTGHFATAAEVDDDLTRLAPITRAIRTYAALEGPFDVPAIAQRHGLRVWQGIWLGGDRVGNAREMARAIDMAKRYPETIERVIVGNEVLLRRDLPAAELIADIDQVRAAVRQPVAYADVSDFWDQFPQVAPHVDVVLVHLLPYWEDVPTGIGHAVATVGAVYDHFTKLFPGKTVAIGETGWPSRGRQRRDALPSRINETRFLRDFMALAAAKHVEYNFIEAFDQNWKYENEGVVGASWGLFNADRSEKIPAVGPLREDPFWVRHALWSVACGLVLTTIGLTAIGRAGPAAKRHQVMVVGMLLGTALGIAMADALPVLYDNHVRLAAAVNIAGQGLLAGLMMGRLSGAIGPAPGRKAAQATERVIALLRLRRSGTSKLGLFKPGLFKPGLLEDLWVVFAWAAAVDQVLLVFDPRYRDFPWPSYAVPLVVAGVRLWERDAASHGGREEIFLAASLCIGALASAVQEGPLNGQSLVWNACVLLLSAPLWRSVLVSLSLKPDAACR